MNIYKISQTVNDDYDTYDSAVVVAADAKQAVKIHPNGKLILADASYLEPPYTWTNPENVLVEYIGVADSKYKEPCVICASFNAG